MPESPIDAIWKTDVSAELFVTVTEMKCDWPAGSGGSPKTSLLTLDTATWLVGKIFVFMKAACPTSPPVIEIVAGSVGLKMRTFVNRSSRPGSLEDEVLLCVEDAHRHRLAGKWDRVHMEDVAGTIGRWQDELGCEVDVDRCCAVRDNPFAPEDVAPFAPDEDVEPVDSAAVGPVIAEDEIVARSSGDDVVATFAEQLVEPFAAGDDVGTQAPKELVGTGAAVEPVLSGSADGEVVAVAGVDDVVAASGEEEVWPDAAPQHIGTITAENFVGACVAEDDISAWPTEEVVEALLTLDEVVARPAADRVVARAREDAVVARTAEEHVVAVGSDEDIGTGCTRVCDNETVTHQHRCSRWRCTDHHAGRYGQRHKYRPNPHVSTPRSQM